MLKVLLYSFSMSIPDLVNKQECPMFVLLITGYFKVLYNTGQNRSGFKVFKLKVHHFKFSRGRYAKSILAIIPGLYFLKNVICCFFLFFFFIIVFHSSALYNEILGMLLSLEL